MTHESSDGTAELVRYLYINIHYIDRSRMLDFYFMGKHLQLAASSYTMPTQEIDH